MHATRALLAALTLTALAAAPAAAQSGGFADGDLYLYSRHLEGMSSQDGGILAIDPLSGQTTQIVDFSFSAYGKGVMAFDTYRQRLVFYTSIDQGDGPVYGLWTSDAAGNLELAATGTDILSGLAPTPWGEIYAITAFDGAAPFKYFDAANREQVLYDADGTTPFGFSGIYNHNDAVMTYDPGTHALFVAYRGSSGPSCAGGSSDGTTIKKLPLDAGGRRVIGPVECRTFQADPTQSTEVPSNWSRTPDGALILVCDTPGLGSGEKPRVARVDPVHFNVSAWASPGGFVGADQLTAGAYSSVRGEVLVLDTLNDVLRGYVAGGSGPGNVLAPLGPLSPSPGSGEFATLVEIDNGDCGGGFQPLGVGLAGTGNLVPTLIGGGCPQVGSPMTLSVRDVVGGTYGVLFIGLVEGQLPFRGGTVYMGELLATLNITLFGPPGEPGVGNVHYPFGVITDPGLSGLSMLFQAAFFDPAAIKNASLTQGLRVEFN